MELTEAARLERNRYVREWRAKNKERVKEINRRYWERKIEKEGFIFAKDDHNKNENGSAT